MLQRLINTLAEAIVACYERKRKSMAWTVTRECWQCGASIPASHVVCGYCGVPLQSTPTLNPVQKHVAEMDTIQVSIVPPSSAIRVDRDRHPLLYQYLATRHDTGRTEPIQMSAYQTKRLMQKLEI